MMKLNKSDINAYTWLRGLVYALKDTYRIYLKNMVEIFPLGILKVIHSGVIL